MWRLHLELRLTCRISTALSLIKVETVSARELFMGGSTSWNNCSVMMSVPILHIHQDFQLWRTLHVHIQYNRLTLGMNKNIFKSTSLWFAVVRKHCLIRLAIGHVSGDRLRNACSCGRKTAWWNWLECRCLLFNLTFLCNTRAWTLKKQERQQPNML